MMSARQARSRMATGRTSIGFTPNGNSPGVLMPFDHAATFELKGTPGNIIQDVINVSSDGIFVATAIGYGFEQDRAQAVDLTSLPSPLVAKDLTLGSIPAAALIEGFRLNPRAERLLLDDLPLSAGGRPDLLRERKLSSATIDPTHRLNILQQLKPAEEISFLFSIVDSGTGRELQDEPIHNLASLGKSNGERPFRVLAQPLMFQPRSTVRLQIVERSEGLRGILFIVLYGFKILGGGANRADAAALMAMPAFAGNANQHDRVIPFDYVSKFQLTGTPGNLLEDEVPINVEGGFIATSIGYGLGVDNLDVEINRAAVTPNSPPPDDTTTNLGNVPLSAFPVSALQEGLRIRPSFVRIAFNNTGVLNTEFPLNALDRVFERLNRPEDVSFRYSIFETGTGRELQNQPIHNIAGLGIANGDRPFKQLARPMRFFPRSTIRVNVQEGFGRGTLFIVFQGYKVLSDPTMSQGPGITRRARVR